MINNKIYEQFGLNMHSFFFILSVTKHIMEAGIKILHLRNVVSAT